MDVYVVRDGSRIVRISARLQGAELARADEAKRIVDEIFANNPTFPPEHGPLIYSDTYDAMTIENFDVQDMDD